MLRLVYSTRDVLNSVGSKIQQIYGFAVEELVWINLGDLHDDSIGRGWMPSLQSKVKVLI